MSILVHVTLLLPAVRPTPMVLHVPAPELAVAISANRYLETASLPDPSPATRLATATKATVLEPQSITSSAASDAVTNHLRGLLQESLKRYFIYPPMAHRNGWEGQVKLLVHLDHNGRLHALRVVQSSGYPLLDEDALLTLRRIGSIPHARAWLPEQGYATTLPVVYKLTEG